MVSLIQLDVGTYAEYQVRAEMQTSHMQRSIPLQVATLRPAQVSHFFYTT